MPLEIHSIKHDYFPIFLRCIGWSVSELRPRRNAKIMR